MSDLMFVEDGFSHEQLLEGLTDAAANYQALVDELGKGAVTRREGLTNEERVLAEQLNPDIFIADALRVPEDMKAIVETEGFKRVESKHIEVQYALDDFVGRAVAQNLFAVVNSAEARAILPHRTVALFEVNANRGFPRGREDSMGCHGLPVDWLGYVAVDLDYEGANKLKANELDSITIDYLGETGAWTTSGRGIDRNAARIRIRPARPIENRHPYSMFPMPRDVFEKRAGLSVGEVNYLFPEWAVLSGEYRICRAVCILHDLTDWKPRDFMNKDQARKAMGRVLGRLPKS